MKYINSFIFLLALISITGCKSEPEHLPTGKELPPAQVKTVMVAAQKGHLQTEVVGTVQSIKQAVIAARVTGTITKMPVVLGSTVKAEDVLVKISAEEISAQAVQAQTQLEQAKRNLEREKKLLAKNAATGESVKSLEERYRVAEAAHREATTMLSYTKVTAPFDGVITVQNGNVGALATTGPPLLHLEDNSKLQIVASVPEALVLQINHGDKLTVQIPVTGTDSVGTVAEVAPSADPVTRTAVVKLNIEPHPGLRSGQFARVIIPGERKLSLFIPSATIRTFGQMEQVFVIEDNKAHLRLIRTGIVIGDQTEILAGLEEGETIALFDETRLIDGQPVTVIQ